MKTHSEDFPVRKNKKHIEFLIKYWNPKIFIKINNIKYEQIYIDYITNNGNVIIYDNKFNKRRLSDYVSDKRNLKRASAILRFVYYSFSDSTKLRLYNYLSNPKSYKYLI